jgi:hypothetical protein
VGVHGGREVLEVKIPPPKHPWNVDEYSMSFALHFYI